MLNFNAKKDIDYLKNIQDKQGSYRDLRPNPHVSVYFLGILSEMGVRPEYKNTVNWVLSLQTGHRGFGETTGENSWDYTTFWGSQMHKFLGLKPNYEEDFVNFVQAHQNYDGGFGSMVGHESELGSTLNWAISLIDLGYRIKYGKELCNFLLLRLNYFRGLPLEVIFKIVYILEKLECEIKPKEDIANFIFHLRDSRKKFLREGENLYYLYYCTSILKLLKKNIVTPHLEFDFSSPEKVYFSIKLMKMFGTFMPNEFINRIINYCYSHELKGGGFYQESGRNIYIGCCAINALKIFSEKPRYKKELISELKFCQNKDGGFGYPPGSRSNEKQTYWLLDTLRCLNALDIIDTDKLKIYLSRLSENVSPFLSYYLTGAYEIINAIPYRYKEIVENLLEFKNNDGGFGWFRNTQSEMYEVFRAINAIKNIENILERNKIKHGHWIKSFKKEVVSWIFSCENAGGGFSWMPQENSYVQPTYLALTVLEIFNAEIKNTETHIKWILQFQNEDGGFNGGVKGTPSEVHFTFWALKSLSILKYFDSNWGNKISQSLKYGAK
jgi:prenyltransferase beta subunit